MSRVVIIGSGVAGLVAALRAVDAGLQVTLVTKGIGGLYLSQGTVDILGYAPDRVDRPLDALAGFAAAHPEHPYARLSADVVREGVRYLADAVGSDLLVGEPDRNVVLPTAVGALRPTALAQPSMLAGQPVADARFVIVGLKQLRDFYPELIAGNLDRTELPGGGRISARAARIDLRARAGESDSNALGYARSLDDPTYRRRFAAAVATVVRDGETVGLPALLGNRDLSAWTDVAHMLGHPVFEIPLPPPSVPGIRLSDTLLKKVKDARVRLVHGSPVLRLNAEARRVKSVTAGTAGAPRDLTGDAFVYAPGGFESGALVLDSYGQVSEPTFGLPLVGAEGGDGLVHGEYWGGDQPLFRVGVGVDDGMRVLAGDTPVYDNLFAAGGILGGASRWREKSGEGIAAASAVQAIDTIVREQS